jgi:hemophore-related protein
VHVRSLLAGVGITAVAVAVPLVVVSTASAAPSSSTSSSCPRQAVHQEVQQYLTDHPDVAAEIADLKKLPQDQRPAARQKYLAAHPDVAAQLKTFRQDRRGAWAEGAGARAAELDKYPAVKAMVEQLGKTPAGQRAAAAKQYLADHADAKDQLKQLRTDNRTRVQSCRAGK